MSKSTTPTTVSPAARTPYEEFSSPERMHRDCRKAVTALGLPTTGIVTPDSPIRYENHPYDRPKPEISISAATARLGDLY